jgi:hypothetical protein
MILNDDKSLLFIEPQNSPFDTPISDELTEFFLPIFQKRIADNLYFKGVHYCKCGATSSNQNYTVTLGDKKYVTNSLAMHYLEYHRDEVPESEISKIQNALNQPKGK